LNILKSSSKDLKCPCSSISELTLSYGLKLFPDNFRKKGENNFKQADEK